MDAKTIRTVATWVVGVAGTTAGILAAFLIDDIKLERPLGPAPPSVPVLLFWAVCAVAAPAALVALIAALRVIRGEWRQREHEHAEREARALREQEKAKQEELRQRRLETLPPDEFLEAYDTLWQQSAKVVAVMMAHRAEATENPWKEPAAVREVIRSLIATVATLAFYFDRRPEATYAANLMVFRPMGVLAEPQITVVEPHVKFLGHPLRQVRGTLDGLLVLDRDLSVRFAKQEASGAKSDALPKDVELIPLVLPVPVDSDAGTRTALLPGAPEAFVRRTTCFYEDTTTLADHCRAYCNFAPAVIDEIDEYFRKGPVRIRSLVSTAISGPDTEQWIGVVNLHRDSTGLLQGAKEPAARFVSVMRPYMTTIGYLLQHLINDLGDGPEGRLV